MQLSNSTFRKTLLVALATALIAATLPFTSAFAAPVQDTSTPPTTDGNSTQRLERLWNRAQNGVEKFGNVIERSATMVKRIQTLIDKAAENGKDVSALQAALDAYEQAIDEAGPMYKEAQSIVAKHAGFDADGKVTDVEQARSTLKELGAQLKELREQIGAPGKALREAVKAFREANPPPDKNSGR
jgi:chromosome segregation ATPase